MKPLLFTISLFLTVSVSGQIDPNAEAELDTTAMCINKDDYGYEWIEFRFKDYIDAKIDKRIIVLWREYDIECWNDSTLKHTHVPQWNDPCYAQRGNLAHGYYYELVCTNPDHFTWVHKEPTLPGFMEFIERKINTKEK